MPIPEDDEEKTRIIRRPPARPSDDDDTSATTRRSGKASASESDESDDSDDSGMTRLVGPTRRSPEAAEPEQETGGEQDPVVGWLVVLAGPGRGNAVKLGYGQNSVGRDKGERCRVDYGDGSISRKKHCFVIYEPRKRQYLLRPGDGSNLVYLNGELVSEPTPMEPGSLIELGKTTLKFVAFCSAEFDWQDAPEKPGEA